MLSVFQPGAPSTYHPLVDAATRSVVMCPPTGIACRVSICSLQKSHRCGLDLRSLILTVTKFFFFLTQHVEAPKLVIGVVVAMFSFLALHLVTAKGPKAA